MGLYFLYIMPGFYCVHREIRLNTDIFFPGRGVFICRLILNRNQVLTSLPQNPGTGIYTSNTYSEIIMPRVRICAQCGQMTELQYTDEEWEDRDFLCELCEEQDEVEVEEFDDEEE